MYYNKDTGKTFIIKKNYLVSLFYNKNYTKFTDEINFYYKEMLDLENKDSNIDDMTYSLEMIKINLNRKYYRKVCIELINYL